MPPIRGLVLTWTDDGRPMVEPWNLGQAGKDMVEPWDLLGVPAGVSMVEEWWLLGSAGKSMVEPYYFGSKASLPMVEPWDLLGAADVADVPLPDGSPASPTLGYWQKTSAGYEDLGPITTD